MSTVMAGPEKSQSEYRSPARVLVSFFRRSRDRWKQKCQDAKAELKRFKVRVSDVSKSREAWKEKYEERQRELESLQSYVQQLEGQLAQVTSAASAAEQK